MGSICCREEREGEDDKLKSKEQKRIVMDRIASLKKPKSNINELLTKSNCKIGNEEIEYLKELLKDEGLTFQRLY